MDLTQGKHSVEQIAGRLQSKRALVGWTSFLCVAVSAASFFFVVWPQWNRVGTAKELDVAAMEATLNERESYLAQLKALRANYEKIPQEDITLLSRILPTSRAVPELIQQLEAMSRESGVGLSSVNLSDVAETRASARQQLQAEVGGAPAAVSKDKSVKQVTVQLQIETTQYDRFKQFINALQSNDRILDVESYLFASDQEIQTVTARTYYLQPS